MEYKTTQFTVDELKIEATKIGIKGGGIWHTLWKEYEGTPTDAYLLYQKMGDITGQFVEVEYYEKPNPKNEKYPYKTITKIKPTVKSKETEVEPPSGKAESGPDWDRINADKQHSITLAIAMKLAVQSMPAKVKDLDYEEIEVRMVKFNAIMEKYLGVVMPEQKFSPAIQKEWDAFHKWIEDNKNVLKQGTYDTAMIWLKGLEKPTVEKLLLNRAKIQAQIKGNTSSGEYESYHDSLITGCCEILKTENRLPVIQTLDNMVKAWGVEGLEKLSETSENQCQNLVDEFDKAQKEEEDLNLPY